MMVMAKRFGEGGHRQTKATWSFWVTFLAVNMLLFLPFFLLDQETTFLPRALFADSWWLGINRLLIWRANLDPWRISVELVVLIALWANIQWVQRPFLRIIISGVYLLALCYYPYEAVMIAVYHSDAVFYSQYFLARDGIPFLLEHVQTAPWLIVLALAGLAGLLIGMLWLVNQALNHAMTPPLDRISRLTLTVLALLSLGAVYLYQVYTARPQMVVSSLAIKLQKNIADSLLLYRDIRDFDDGAVRSAYDYTGHRLVRKPDLYVIFVESYGSVLYKRSVFRAAYTSLLTELENQLNDAGWQVASRLSESPTWGGGSWMAYTSMLFGMRIDTHPRYLSLFNKYQVERYPDFGRYLQSQGYYYAWVSPIATELDEQSWNRYLRFFGVDQWLRYRDFDFHGPLYGWGPAPPDQYVLHAANEKLQAATDRPLFFMTITQNSHYPWAPQPGLVADWRSLNQTQGEAIITAQADNPASSKQRDYLVAVEYQLRMLTDFILTNDNQESIFVLVGDHQPPQVSRRSDGWAAPVHIISQDVGLIEALDEYDFSPGLRVKQLETDLHHAGLYSLLARLLLSRYGADPTTLPSYLPGGVEVEQSGIVISE
jgi:hypothetical protein